MTHLVLVDRAARISLLLLQMIDPLDDEQSPLSKCINDSLRLVTVPLAVPARLRSPDSSRWFQIVRVNEGGQINSD